MARRSECKVQVLGFIGNEPTLLRGQAFFLRVKPAPRDASDSPAQ